MGGKHGIVFRHYILSIPRCSFPVSWLIYIPSPWLGTYYIALIAISYPSSHPSPQWPFQEPKPEVPTIYKAYVREYPHNSYGLKNMGLTYLHFRILKFPLTQQRLNHH